MISEAFSKLAPKQAWCLSLLLSLAVTMVLAFGFIYPAWQQGLVLQRKLVQARAMQSHSIQNLAGEALSFSEALEVLNRAPLASIHVLTWVQEQGHYHVVLRADAVTLKLFTQAFAYSHLLHVDLQRQSGADVYELDLELADLRMAEKVLPAQDAVAPAKTLAQVIGQLEQKGHHYCIVKEGPQVIHFVEQRVC